jgi:hypothetical protein
MRMMAESVANKESSSEFEAIPRDRGEPGHRLVETVLKRAGQAEIEWSPAGQDR